MAAITTDKTFNFETLRSHLNSKLPEYARPPVRAVYAPIFRSPELSRWLRKSLVRDDLKPSEGNDTVWVDDRKHRGIRQICWRRSICGAAIPQAIGFWLSATPGLYNPRKTPIFCASKAINGGGADSCRDRRQMQAPIDPKAAAQPLDHRPARWYNRQYCRGLRPLGTTPDGDYDLLVRIEHIKGAHLSLGCGFTAIESALVCREQNPPSRPAAFFFQALIWLAMNTKPARQLGDRPFFPHRLPAPLAP